MKSENDFLQGMWETVSKIQYEEQQKALARMAHKHFVKRQILNYIYLGAAFLIAYSACITLPIESDYVYAFSFAAILIGYTAETLLGRNFRRNYQ